MLEFLKAHAEKQGLPLQTLEDITSTLNECETPHAAASMARLFAKFGRGTPEAKKYAEQYKA